MKKIYYLLTALSIAFTACQKSPELAPETYTKTNMQITLPATTVYTSLDDATAKIPALMGTTYPQLGNGSSATVTFTLAAFTPPVADNLPDSVSLSTKAAYTLTAADYKLLPGNTFTDFTAAQILTWLPIKFPNLPQYKTDRIKLVTFTYYENGTTSTATQSFIYTLTTNTWRKIYTISAAQYTSIGKGGTFNDFSSTDDAALPNYLNTLLKADLTVSSTAKVGDGQYVSYKYFSTSNYQRVMSLVFDGTNWVNKPLVPAKGILQFIKKNGVWVLNAATSYTLTKDDYTYIGTQTTVGTAAGRASVAKFPDFNTSVDTDTDFWSPTDLNAALAAVLTSKFKSTASKDDVFLVTYTNYSFGKTSNLTNTFVYDGSAFVFQAPPATK